MNEMTDEELDRLTRPAGNPGGRGTKKQRVLGNAHTVEATRQRLQMGQNEFAAALGLSSSGYSGMVKRNEVTKAVELAAECLSRRHAANPLETLRFLVTISRGVLRAIPLSGNLVSKTIVLPDGKTYYLVEAGEIK